MKDYYKILQIDQHASRSEIQRAYKRLALQYHPDKNQSINATEMFQEINEAYRILNNEGLRLQYDTLIQALDKPTPAPPPPQARKRYKHPMYKPSFRTPTKKSAEQMDELVRPYLKYAYLVSKACFVFCLLLLLDYSLPDEVVYEEVAFVSGSADDRTVTLTTKEGSTFDISGKLYTYFKATKQVVIARTAILKINNSIASSAYPELVYKHTNYIYGSFSFFPITLFICATIGTFIHRRPYVDFDFGVVNAVLFIIIISVIYATGA